VTGLDHELGHVPSQKIAQAFAHSPPPVYPLPLDRGMTSQWQTLATNIYDTNTACLFLVSWRPARLLVLVRDDGGIDHRQKASRGRGVRPFRSQSAPRRRRRAKRPPPRHPHRHQGGARHRRHAQPVRLPHLAQPAVESRRRSGGLDQQGREHRHQ
jgi:hypothetical protein